ncbi:hypothetical protein [Sphingomonas sp. Y38-1Y]|uniref:PAS domain-containing protein n=1 Tax=Sphingomonas sp. Y38-1Y TaxID=3078265 RepID=UPI0028E214A1|nr:hypothetical protein [Sphingomonas sp. Y38-1Y]
MNMVQGTGGEVSGAAGGAGHPLDIGSDERRMHVRAYNYWVSLLGGRAYPSIEDLDPANIADFGANSVLLDFSIGIDDPSIQYLGRSLREECGVDAGIRKISEVPSRSLLSRLTDHYLQIIANRAPIGFEAEFVGQRGDNTLYRGILMPFSSDDDTIDFIYGVINWKVMVDAETQARLSAEVEAARRDLPRIDTPAPAAWADGPSSGFDAPPVDEASVTPDLLDADIGLADLLDHARACAADVGSADQRTRAALYRALDRAYAFAEAAARDAEGYAELLADAGLKPQARAPMTPIVKLVFGANHDKTRLTEYGAVLTHARRHDIAADAFAAFLSGAEGGVKGIVAAERAARRPASRPDTLADAAATLRARAPIAALPIAAGDDEFVLLLARAGLDGMLEVVARVENETGLTERAIRRAGV